MRHVAQDAVEAVASPLIRVENTRLIQAELASRFYGFDDDMILVGVTGTNGKTTVTHLLESIFKHAGMKPGILGTLNYRWPGHSEEAVRTTPESLDIYRYLARMSEAGTEIAVMEVSSHALALNRVDGMSFKVAVFTNLSRDHLDFHPSFNEYGEIKARLFEKLGHGGIGIVNGDDPMHELMQNSTGERCVSFGMSHDNLHYRISNIEFKNLYTSYTLDSGRNSYSISSPLWGNFNVMNSACAAVTGLELGLDISDIRGGLANIKNIPGRMEVFTSPSDFKTIVDYAHTRGAVENIISAVKEFTRKRVLIVIGCGGDRDKGKRPEMGRIASQNADFVFVTSDNPRSEDPDGIIAQIVDGIRGRDKYEVVPDRKEAILLSLEMAEPGDSVIIAGKGHETYQEINGVKNPFDDREVVRSYFQQQVKV